jgi:hypothetical protein
VDNITKARAALPKGAEEALATEVNSPFSVNANLRACVQPSIRLFFFYCVSGFEATKIDALWQRRSGLDVGGDKKSRNLRCRRHRDDTQGCQGEIPAL